MQGQICGQVIARAASKEILAKGEIPLAIQQEVSYGQKRVESGRRSVQRDKMVQLPSMG